MSPSLYLSRYRAHSQTEKEESLRLVAVMQKNAHISQQKADAALAASKAATDAVRAQLAAAEQVCV